MYIGLHIKSLFLSDFWICRPIYIYSIDYYSIDYYWNY